MAELMLINPRKRRRKHKAKARKHVAKRRRRHSVMSAAPVRHKRRRYMSNPRKRSRKYRRNPSMRGFRPMAFMKDTLMPSAVGAAGALGLDMLLGFVPLPAMLKTPTMRPLVRIAGAVGIGIVAGMVTNKRIGEQVGAGALTVVLYDTLKGFVTAQFPTLTLGELPSQYPTMEYLSPAPQVEDLSAYVTSDYSPVGEYVY